MTRSDDSHSNCELRLTGLSGSAGAGRYGPVLAKGGYSLPLGEANHYEIFRYSITSSARIRIDCGIVMPIALAVLRFTMSSNLVGRSTGRLAGLAPLRILSGHAELI